MLGGSVASLPVSGMKAWPVDRQLIWMATLAPCWRHFARTLIWIYPASFSFRFTCYMEIQGASEIGVVSVIISVTPVCT